MVPLVDVTATTGVVSKGYEVFFHHRVNFNMQACELNLPTDLCTAFNDNLSLQSYVGAIQLIVLLQYDS